MRNAPRSDDWLFLGEFVGEGEARMRLMSGRSSLEMGSPHGVPVGPQVDMSGVDRRF